MTAGPGRVLFGTAGLRIALIHLRAIGLLMAILLLVALAIDYADSFPEISASAAAEGRPLVLVLLQYSAYRTADIVTRLLPMATLAGAFAAEVLRRTSRETIVLATAGFSPAQSLLALFWLVVALGAVQHALEKHLRPAAVFAQVEAGLGSYAERFGRTGIGRVRWFVSGDLALRARVRGAPEVELHEVELFRIRGETVREVVSAPLALPAGDDRYRLPEATLWTPDERGSLHGRSAPGLTLALPVRPTRLKYLDVAGFYIPHADLERIAREGRGEEAGVRTAIWRRRTAALLPGAFLLLGASLAQVSFAAQFTRPARVLVAATAGYVAVVSVKQFWSLGEFGAVAPQTAVLAPVVLAGLMTVLIQLRLRGRPL